MDGKRVRTMEELKDSRLLFDKQPPAFGFFFLLIFVSFLLLLAWSMKAPKVYTIQTQGVVTNEEANYVMCTYTGEIDRCFMEEGMLVEQGDLLLTIKSTDYDLQEKQLQENRESLELVIRQNQRLVNSIKDNVNYFEERLEEDSLYYHTYERYQAKVEQTKMDASMFQAYGYTKEQMEEELLKNQSKTEEVYYSAIQEAEAAMAQEVNQILQEAEEDSKEETDKLESHAFQETSLEEAEEGDSVEEDGTEGKDSREEAEIEEQSEGLPKEQQQEEKQAEEDEIPIEEKKDQTSSDEDSGENKEEKGEEDSSNEGEGSSQNQEQREESSEQSTKEETSKAGLVLTDLDLGDYRGEMVTGEKQLLFVTPIPSQYTADKLSFTSLDLAVAQINGLGRITAIKPGKTTIHVQLETISRSFELTVKEAENTRILVSGIEVQEYTRELEEGRTLSLSVTLLPRNATKQEVTFTSMDTSVATVNSTGVVKGIKKGKTEIELKADGYSKKIPIEVIVKTKQIKVEPAYVILKTGESHTLQTKVIPEQADQQLTYKSKEHSC